MPNNRKFIVLPLPDKFSIKEVKRVNIFQQFGSSSYCIIHYDIKLGITEIKPNIQQNFQPLSFCLTK